MGKKSVAAMQSCNDQASSHDDTARFSICQLQPGLIEKQNQLAVQDCE